jgi:adenylate cyclase
LQADFSLEAPIRIGAGINSGIASIGNLGSAAAADHTALGDVVNKAFRLQSATKAIPTDVALGQATYNFLIRSVSAAAELFEQHTVPLKGYQEPVPAYALSLASLQQLLKLVRAQVGG